MSNKILIIEDDVGINDMLMILLRQNGYNTISAYSGTEGLLINSSDIDLVLLDLMLPGKSGEEVIKELKAKYNVPVIVISAVHDISRKVELFKLGADDYVTKPFSNEELLARISARLRTTNERAAADKLVYKNVELSKNGFTVTVKGVPAELSKHEFALLKLLMENQERTCTKSMIYDSVWDYENSADDNTLNVHISKLRKKLRELDPSEEYIETVWGVGYRLKKLS